MPIYRLICIANSVKDNENILSTTDTSSDYLHIHLLKSKYLKPIEEFVIKDPEESDDKNLYQWGTIFEKDAHGRFAKVSAAEIKQYGQVGIGSIAKGDEQEGDFIGGGEGFLFDSQNFRITKGNKVFPVTDDQTYWTFQIANLSDALRIPELFGQKISGRENLMHILKTRSGGRSFVATFDAIFDGRFFARSNGIFPEDMKHVENPHKSLLDKDIQGGHLVGGSDNSGDIASLKEAFDLAEVRAINFSCRIVSSVILKPIEELKIITKDKTASIQANKDLKWRK